MRPAVLLDRDTPTNEDVAHLDRFERLTRFPLSIDAVSLLDCDLGATAPATPTPASAHVRTGRPVCARS